MLATNGHHVHTFLVLTVMFFREIQRHSIISRLKPTSVDTWAVRLELRENNVGAKIAGRRDFKWSLRWNLELLADFGHHANSLAGGLSRRVSRSRGQRRFTLRNR